MNSAGPLTMNGYQSSRAPSTSANTYPEYSHLNYNQPSYSPNGISMHPGHRQIHNQPAQSMAHNHWQSNMAQQSHIPHHPPQQQQHVNQPAWPNAMQNQSYHGGMANMAGFNMPFISQQIIQDAFALSLPVGPADEKILLQALVESRGKHQTYKDALNSLHGKNGHSASLWKDYYLEHKERLDEWITVYLNPPKTVLQTAKKPSPTSFKVEDSPTLPPKPLPRRQKQLPRQNSAAVGQSKPTTGRRSTINSLTTFAPVYDDRLPPPNAEIKIPDPPSRSPSPPTKIVPHKGRGYKFTAEDKDFFLKFIAWHLKKDPSLTRNDLCVQLAEKAPHHSAQSWASHWSNKHDIPDKIYAAAKGELIDASVELESDPEVLPIRRRPTYQESSSEDNESDDEGEDGVASSISEEEEDDDVELVRCYSESEMGAKGGPFTDADAYIMARYVASFPKFEHATYRERWDPYEKRYPQRSSKAWAESYRRYERRINTLVRKIRREQEKDSQLARPTWAKRKQGDEEEVGQSKRGRTTRMGPSDLYL